MTTQVMQRQDPERAIEFVPFGAADKIKLSVKIIQNAVAVPTKNGATCTERDALKFLMMCQAQRLNPFAGDAYLVGYDGKNGPQFSLITAHQAVLKRAETCQDYEGMESGIIMLADDGAIAEREGDFHLEDEKVVGGWARVHRKGRKDTYRRIRLSRFNNGFAQWAVDPAGMIVKCAEADALRSTFPTLIGGLYVQGEQNEAADRIVSQMVARPIFELPARGNLEAPKQSLQHTDEGEGTDLAPVTQAPAQQSEQPPTAEPHPVVLITKSLKARKITEAELLNYLRGIRRIDESLKSIQEVSLTAPAAIEWIWEHWTSIAEAIVKEKAKSEQPKAAA